MPSNNIIHVGNIIRLRSRLWRVDGIFQDILEASPIDGNTLLSRKFFIPVESISLAQLDFPSSKCVGNYMAQQLLIRAYRLSMIHGTAPLLSLQRSRVIPETFQMVPVVMSLEMSRVRLLIADDVGLGKTIEAGLILTELLTRKRSKKILLICPANLREQWKEALIHFFHIHPQIISARHRRGMERKLPPGSDPWENFPILISSMDYAKSPENKVQILEHKWDIVVIDEAHNLAKPHQSNETQQVEMSRWELARDVSQNTEHLILLTATPHNGYTDTFASLLRMLDVSAVVGPDHNPKIIKEVAMKHVCQRRRKDVEEELRLLKIEGSPFPQRDSDEDIVEPSELESSLTLKIEELGKHMIIAADLEKPKHLRIAKWTIIHFHKRRLSSPKAIVKSLEYRLKKIAKVLEEKEEKELNEDLIKESEAKAIVLDNDPGERSFDEELESRLESQIFGSNVLLKKEVNILKDALSIAKKITPLRDSKLTALLNGTLRKMIRVRPKTIIFTKYKTTLDYLEEQIPKHRHYEKFKVITLYGELNEVQRREKFMEFQKASQAIMIATDAISEGLNLQYLCSQIIHYELPWNPNRLEQRNGRIDRYGQPDHVVNIRTMVVDDFLEATILKLLVKKAQTIRIDHGFSPPFFGDETSMLDLIREHKLDIQLAQTRIDEFCRDLTSVTETTLDPLSPLAIKRIEDESFYGQTSFNLQEIRKRQEDTENLIGSREEIEKFIRSGFNKFGCKMKDNHDGTFRLEILNSELRRGLDKDVFESCSFDPFKGKNDSNQEILDLGHPIVQNLISMVKGLSFKETESYGRTCCISAKGIDKVTALYTFIARYVTQSSPPSIVEELLSTGLELFTGGIIKDEVVLNRLGSSQPAFMDRNEEEMQDDLGVALSKDIQKLMNQKAVERCEHLRIEREDLKKKLLKQGEARWAEGLENLSVASVDLLCVTLLYPTNKTN